MTRVPLFSVLADDLIFQSFTVSGAGGQGRDHVNYGVRYIHPKSGARGESRDFREQKRNKTAALKRMTESPEFKYWVAQEVRSIDGKQTSEQLVETEMTRREHFRVEVKDGEGRWVDDSSPE